MNKLDYLQTTQFRFQSMGMSSIRWRFQFTYKDMFIRFASYNRLIIPNRYA